MNIFKPMRSMMAAIIICASNQVIADIPGAGFVATPTAQSVQFTNTIPDEADAYSWHWDFGDGNVSTEPSPSHTYSASGNYTVSLTIIDDSGNQAVYTNEVQVGGEQTQNNIMSWVAPYAIWDSQQSAQLAFDMCSPSSVLSRVGLQFWVPGADGSVQYSDHEWYKATDEDVAWWRNWGQEHGVDILLTIHNYIDQWDWDLARTAFDTHKETFVSALVAEVDRLGLDGVDIDLEGPGDFNMDRTAFRDFIQLLSEQLKLRNKILTIDSFHYIYNAPNHEWWQDWVGAVDSIHSMGYNDLYEGGSSYQPYSYQQSAGMLAGHDPKTVLMGMPAWDDANSDWGVSSGRGTSAQAHVQEVRYDLPYGSTGIAIWDMQLKGWKDNNLWCEIADLKGDVPVIVPEVLEPETPDYTVTPIAPDLMIQLHTRPLNKHKRKSRRLLTAIDLHWEDKADNETGFIVEACSKGTGQGQVKSKSKGKGRNKRKQAKSEKNVTKGPDCHFKEIGQTDANVSNFKISHKKGYKRFRVRAVNAAGTSDWSNEVRIQLKPGSLIAD